VADIEENIGQIGLISLIKREVIDSCDILWQATRLLINVSRADAKTHSKQSFEMRGKYGRDIGQIGLIRLIKKHAGVIARGLSSDFFRKGLSKILLV
jgi:hypothetical protein